VGLESTNLGSVERWVCCWVVAYLQLLLIRQQVDDLRPPWQANRSLPPLLLLTPAQVQRAAHRFLLRLGTPAQVTRPAGKGAGRRKGFCPQKHPRHPVVRKSKKRSKRKR
jgi:hypothetical protein